VSDRNYGALRDPELIDKFIDRIVAQSQDNAFAKAKPFAFDIEAGYTGPDAEEISKMQFHPNYILVGISFTNDVNWARYVPIAHDDGDNAHDIVRVAKAFWRLVRTGMGIAHNASYELKGMSRWFREVLWNDPEYGPEIRENKGLFPIFADTMIEVWLSQEYEPAIADITQKDLKSSVLESFGIRMTHFAELFPKTENDMGPITKAAAKKLRFNTRYSTSARVIAYACEDSVGALMLHQKHWHTLVNGPRKFITKVEHDLIPVLVEMEMGPVDPETGVAQGNMYLNWAHIFRKDEELERFRQKYQEELMNDFSERLGRVVTINLNSPPQLVKALYDPVPAGLGLPINDRFRSKKTGAPSTGDDALKVLANTDPLIRKILEYRQVVKLGSSYLHKYATQLNYAGTGFVFPNHNQAGTVTGRMSVDQVSYQQWPKPQKYKLDDGTTFEMNFRDLLISPPEHRIIGYDYSQVELRFLAAVAGEDSMLAAFASGVDIHKLTASRMFKIPIEQVDKKSRSKGKTLNFGIVYQQGPDALAESLSASGTPTTKDEAATLLEQYYAGFPKLRNWMNERVAEGHNQGYVETFFGRKFVVWEYKDKRNWIRDKGDRMCINAPIQGGAADYIKVAMVRVYRKLKEHGLQDKVRLSMMIHDALEFYVHDSVSTAEVIELLNPCVSYPVKGLPVQIRADWHEGPTWGVLTEVKLTEDGKIDHYEVEDVDAQYETYEEALAKAMSIQKEKAKDKATAVAPPPEVRAEIEASLAPMALDDEPPWMTDSMREKERQQETPPRKWVVILDEMPDEEQWAEFQKWLSSRPGADTLVLRMPEGEMTERDTYSISPEDQGTISLLLGGADLADETREVSTDDFAEVSL
jgi:DNA polymerase I-like protein with 3'-5' exonuclease and polymerase domains